MGCHLPDTFTLSYSSSATSEAGGVAAFAEEKKKAKASQFTSCYTFTAVAIEISGYSGPQSGTFTTVAIETSEVFRPPVWYFYSRSHWNIWSIQAPSLVLLQP